MRYITLIRIKKSKPIILGPVRMQIEIQMAILSNGHLPQSSCRFLKWPFGVPNTNQGSIFPSLASAVPLASTFLICVAQSSLHCVTSLVSKTLYFVSAPESWFSRYCDMSLKAQWDDTRDFYLLQHLLQAACLGKKTDSGFKKDVWTELARNFNVKFGLSCQVSQFHTRAQAVYSCLSQLIVVA